MSGLQWTAVILAAFVLVALVAQMITSHQETEAEKRREHELTLAGMESMNFESALRSPPRSLFQGQARQPDLLGKIGKRKVKVQGLKMGFDAPRLTVPEEPAVGPTGVTEERRGELLAALEKVNVDPRDEAVQDFLKGEPMTPEYAQRLEVLFDVPVSYWEGIWRGLR